MQIRPCCCISDQGGAFAVAFVDLAQSVMTIIRWVYPKLIVGFSDDVGMMRIFIIIILILCILRPIAAVVLFCGAYKKENWVCILWICFVVFVSLLEIGVVAKEVSIRRRTGSDYVGRAIPPIAIITMEVLKNCYMVWTVLFFVLRNRTERKELNRRNSRDEAEFDPITSEEL